jgi:hypothetical protein
VSSLSLGPVRPEPSVLVVLCRDPHGPEDACVGALAANLIWGMMAWWTDSGSPLRVREVDVALREGPLALPLATDRLVEDRGFSRSRESSG